MCLNGMYSKVRTGKHLSDNFPVQNGLKQGDIAVMRTPNPAFREGPNRNETRVLTPAIIIVESGIIE
jgi:hypothetical protein